MEDGPYRGCVQDTFLLFVQIEIVTENEAFSGVERPGIIVYNPMGQKIMPEYLQAHVAVFLFYSFTVFLREAPDRNKGGNTAAYTFADNSNFLSINQLIVATYAHDRSHYAINLITANSGPIVPRQVLF
jgi:hypothetical protein